MQLIAVVPLLRAVEGFQGDNMLGRLSQHTVRAAKLNSWALLTVQAGWTRAPAFFLPPQAALILAMGALDGTQPQALPPDA